MSASSNVSNLSSSVCLWWSMQSLGSSFRSHVSKEEWICEACSYENADSSNPRCSVCGSDRESAGKATHTALPSTNFKLLPNNATKVEKKNKGSEAPNKTTHPPAVEEITVKDLIREMKHESDERRCSLQEGIAPSFPMMSSRCSLVDDDDGDRPPELMRVSRRDARDGSSTSYDTSRSSIRSDISDFSVSPYQF